MGLSTGFKILWGIITAYFNIYSISPKSQSLDSIFYISLGLCVRLIRKFKVIVQGNMKAGL